MSRTLISWGLLSASLIALSACDKPADKATDQPSPQAAQSAPAAPGTTAEPASADTDADDIPTEADFEDEAEQTISTANLESQLDALEKEIGE